MDHIVRSGMFAPARVCMQDAWAPQTGAPPSSTFSHAGAFGSSADVAGSAGAAEQSGPDPATLRRSEKARLRKQHGCATSGAASASKAPGKDWKE